MDLIGCQRPQRAAVTAAATKNLSIRLSILPIYYSKYNISEFVMRTLRVCSVAQHEMRVSATVPQQSRHRNAPVRVPDAGAIQLCEKEARDRALIEIRHNLTRLRFKLTAGFLCYGKFFSWTFKIHPASITSSNFVALPLFCQ